MTDMLKQPAKWRVAYRQMGFQIDTRLEINGRMIERKLESKNEVSMMPLWARRVQHMRQPEGHRGKELVQMFQIQ